ncbi:hypothetical protein [Nocardia gipuzkoensis]
MATPLTTAPDDGAPHPLARQFVLAGRPLRSDCTLECTSRFTDDTWRLSPAIISQSSRLLTLDFTRAPARWRTFVKELCFAMLTGPLPAAEPRPELATVQAHFAAIARFLRWLDTRPTAATGRPAQRLDELDGADLRAYLRDLPATQHSPLTRERTRVSVRVLWRYRTVLSDHLRFDPAHLEEWPDDYRNRRTENATNRIPEQVHGPLLVWAMRFIDDFAEDILTACEHWQAAHIAVKGPILADNAALIDNLRRLLHEHIRDHRPLPGDRGNINLLAIAHTLGCSKKEIDRHHALIAATAVQVGINDQPWFSFPTSGHLDGRPWVDSIVSDQRSPSPYGLRLLATLLQDSSASIALFLEYIPQNLHEWLNDRIEAGYEAADRACALVERELAAGTAFMNSRGLLHLDAHFENILTDGRRLYFGDYGLALSSGFDLSPEETAFFDQNQSYDRGFTSTYLVNWLLTALYGLRREDRGTRATMVRAIAEGKPAEGIPTEAAAILTRHAPIAAAMSVFARAFQQESRSTPYPDQEIRRLLDGQAAVFAQPV